MSEKLYALLFRLYPSGFRDAYSEEAMQLFRDRSRDEHGLFATVRFWFDLLLDLCTSLPREYRNLLRSPVAAPFRQRLTSVPFFDVLEVGSPRPSAFFVAGICSLLVTAAVWAMINHDAARQPWSPPSSTRCHCNQTAIVPATRCNRAKRRRCKAKRRRRCCTSATAAATDTSDFRECTATALKRRRNARCGRKTARHSAGSRGSGAILFRSKRRARNRGRVAGA